MTRKNITLIIFAMITFIRCHPQSPAPGYDFSNFDYTPLSQLAIAVQDEDTNAIKSIIAKNLININYLDPIYHQPLLTLAIWHSKMISIKTLLKLGADPNIISGTDSTTPFLRICSMPPSYENKEFVMDLLLKFGADVNKGSPLSYICSNGKLSELKLLITYGASLNKLPKNGLQSLLCEADINSRLDIMKYLLIDKKLPIPDYCVIRNERTQNEKKVGLRQLVLERQEVKDSYQQELEKEILLFLKAHGQ